MNYEWVFRRDFMTFDQVRELRARIDKAPMLPEATGKGTSQKRVSTHVTHPAALEDSLIPFFEAVYLANEELFGFDLYDRWPNTVNINQYNSEHPEYPWHKDSMPLGLRSDIKLTAILNISDPDKSYTGGEFDLFTGEETRVVDLAVPGSLLIFPSFWYHRVLPVIEGERATLSAWFKGASWR